MIVTSLSRKKRDTTCDKLVTWQNSDMTVRPSLVGARIWILVTSKRGHLKLVTNKFHRQSAKLTSLIAHLNTFFNFLFEIVVSRMPRLGTIISEQTHSLIVGDYFKFLEHLKKYRPNVFWYQLEKGEVAKMAETEQRVQLDSIEHAKAHQFPLTKFTGKKLQISFRVLRTRGSTTRTVRLRQKVFIEDHL